jgi:heptosyltransferase-2
VLPVACRLRRIGIDLALLLPNSFRSAITAWLGGARRIVGYARGGRSWLLTDRLEPLRGCDGRFVPSPIIDAYNRLAEHVGCSRPGYRMRLFTTPEDEAAAEQVWQKHQLHTSPLVVAMNPGAAFGSAKHWPVEHFAELAQKLVDERGASILVLCGPSERDMARQIVAQSQRPNVHSLADEPVSLGLLKACVRRADLLITTDSGPRHFAAAFDRPVVTLFGPTWIAWTETYYAKAIHQQKAVECGPCQLRVCPLDHKCMRLLTPGEVFEAATVLLNRYPRQPTPRPTPSTTAEVVRKAWSWFRGEKRTA